jgi:hypothetical protein
VGVGRGEVVDRALRQLAEEELFELISMVKLDLHHNGNSYY